MKTQVFLTIDTEFSIGGAFEDPEQNKPVGPRAVLCEVDGRSHGLGFLLDTLRASGIRATFFVEALNTYYFGDAPMRDLALSIKAAGHDVQLHVHPCWTYFKREDWPSHLKSDPPSDHMDRRSIEQVTEWLSAGVATFERWGVGRPAALRTGSLIADRTVYDAMERVGLRLSSNIGFGTHRPADSGLHFFSGIHRVGRVTELCVLTYADFQIGSRIHYRTLTITGTSFSEMRTLLLRAHESEVQSVVILTHPFEYVKYETSDFSDLRPNRINQRRLTLLGEFLRSNADRFETATFSDLAREPPPPSPGPDVVLRVPAQRMLGRMVQNGLNTRIRAL